MLIQMNTDNNVSGKEDVTTGFSDTIEQTLERFKERITRIEVHLGDENGDKFGTKDKRCMLEARVKGLDPVTVTHKAENLDMAVTGAAEKLKRSLESTFGKMNRY
jgi:ribosome-associated translation inhibitor RaiA